jgi:S1-C subfamily serine protease
MRRGVIFCLALLLIHVLPAGAAQKQAPETLGQMQLSFAPLVRQTGPAVVNVYARTKVKARSAFADDPFFRRFFGDNTFGMPRERVQNALGSGVIVDSSGVIVTNHHVVRDATAIRVVLPDRREFDAKVLLADQRSDLAVLKIDAGKQMLPFIALADSDEIEVGDIVLAIGNPFGVGQTVTSGIVSALARTEVGVSDYQFFIQTDAAINPGNSGGALVNMQGNLVGINTAIFSRTGGSIGIGFGAELQDVSSEIAESLGLSRPQGALVVTLDNDSPLALAGIKQGDLVMGLNGRDIATAKEFIYRVATNSPGAEVRVKYQRDGKDMEVPVFLAAAPETTPRSETKVEGDNPFAGLTVVNISPAVSEEFGITTAKTGVAVVEVAEGPAQQLGFRKGDVILDVNGHEIDSVDTLSTVLSQGADFWSLAINRNGRQLRLRVSG